MKEPDLLESSISEPEAEYARRFGGISRLYGKQGVVRIIDAHICVIGIGGVGSWVVESLARSGVGAITMIDMDIVATSNINRQILAVSDTIGKDKTIVMCDRIREINPDCNVTMVDDFISRDNLAELILPSYDFIVDCIDNFRVKAGLINFCKQQQIKILTVGGAGGQTDPSKVRQTDLNRTQHDVLLATTRKQLRQKYGYTRNLKKDFSVPCVYSDEQLVYPDGAGGLSSQKPSADTSDESNFSALSCAGGIGSISHVTATFAMFAAAYVLNEIVNAD